MATTTLSRVLPYYYTTFEDYQDNISISAGAETNVSINMQMSGYNPIGVVGVMLENASNSGQYNTWCICRTWHCDSTNANIRIRNLHASATAKIAITVVVLYRKTMTGES